MKALHTAALAALVSLPFVNPHHPFPHASFYTDALSLAAGLVAILITIRIMRDFPKNYGPAFALVWYALILVLQTDDSTGPVPVVACLVLVWAALLVSAGAALRENALAPLVQLALLVGAASVAVLGLTQYYGFGPLLAPAAGPGDALFSTLGNRNYAANYIGCGLATLAALYFDRRLRTLVAVPLAVLLVAALLLTASRSGLIGAWLACSIVFLFYCRHSQNIQAATVGLLVAPFFYFYTPAGERIYQAAMGQGPEELRPWLWSQAWLMFKSAPVLGVGFGNYGAHLLPLNGRIYTPDSHAHNALLHVLAETGLVGASVLVAGLAGWVRRFDWLKPDAASTWALALLVIQFTQALTDGQLWRPEFLGLTAILFGYSIKSNDAR